jgi:DNA-binding beta-propeller fold protein YncE
VGVLVLAGLWLALVASAAAGQLGYDDCLSNGGARNCVDLPPAGPSGPLNGASGVAVSPDGKSVYVASGGPSNGSVFLLPRPRRRLAARTPPRVGGAAAAGAGAPTTPARWCWTA